jgi:ABC-type bacteriocin/lantibiotic exporter with double-glycine peptidase domain
MSFAENSTVFGKNYNSLCGVTSLYIALSLDKKGVGLQEIYNNLKPDERNGTYIRDIVKFCNAYHVNVEVTQLTYKEIKDLRTPVIILTDTADSLFSEPRVSHYVVCKTTPNNTVLIYDAPDDPYYWNGDAASPSKYPAIVIDPPLSLTARPILHCAAIIIVLACTALTFLGLRKLVI